MRVLRIIGLRILIVVPTVIVVSFLAFSLVFLLPGEPARALAGGERATPEKIAQVREELGLEDPLLVQYGRWLTDAVQFDFGNSLMDSRPVADNLLTRMPATLSIGILAVVVSIVLGLAAGLTAGIRPGSLSDKVSIGLATVGIAVPSFVMAILLVRVLALDWKLFPAVRYVPFGTSPVEWLRSIALPGLSLGLLGAGALSRQLRSGLIDSARADYVRTAWAVGSGPTSAFGKHALRNASIPAVAVLGTQMTFVLGGTVVIENIFAISGVGTYLFQATLHADLPVIRAVVMWFVLIQVAVYLLVDVALVLLNPRVSIR